MISAITDPSFILLLVILERVLCDFKKNSLMIAQLKSDPANPLTQLSHSLLQSFTLHGLISPPALQFLCVVVQMRTERPVSAFLPLLRVADNLKMGIIRHLHLFFPHHRRPRANLRVPVWRNEEVVNHVLAANNLRL